MPGVLLFHNLVKILYNPPKKESIKRKSCYFYETEMIALEGTSLKKKKKTAVKWRVGEANLKYLWKIIKI